MRLRLTALKVRRDRDERGAVAILVGLMAIGLFLSAAVVLDLGVMRVDRQQIKSAADSAVLAGIAAGDSKTGDTYSYRVVCGALETLRSNPPFKSSGAFTGLPDSICANLASTPANLNLKCDPDSPTPLVYDQTVTNQGVSYRTVIQSPVNLATQGWTEDSTTPVSTDQSSNGGCDQVSVEIYESRKPGLGSLAISGDMSTGVRSAARILMGSSEAYAPSLLVLERSNCQVLTVNSASNGNIFVKGVGTTPGSIHLDTTATGAGCSTSTNAQALVGKHSDGIVAYGSVSGGFSGIITSVATLNGVASNIVYDSSSNAYGTPGVFPTATTKNAVTGRAQIGRQVVDNRYRTGVNAAISAASTNTNSWAQTAPAGWTTTNCNPSAADLAVTTKLWINCTGNSGITLNNVAIQATDVYFNGFIKNGTIAMPNAQHVYVNNTDSSGNQIGSDGIGFGNGSGFCVRATLANCNPSSVTTGTCSAALTTPRAQLFVRQGPVTLNGGLLRLCNTTMILLSGDKTTGCVPTASNAAPTTTPCTTSPTDGKGTVGITGGATIDWSAPNQYDTVPTPVSVAYANLEDLSMWSESSGSYSFSGGGTMSTTGVYMIPNGNAGIGGGTSQTLFNAQFIARTVASTGQGTVTMTTDPKNAVIVPSPKGYMLVR